MNREAMKGVDSHWVWMAYLSFSIKGKVEALSQKEIHTTEWNR